MAPNKMPVLTKKQTFFSLLIAGLMLFIAGCDNNSQSSSTPSENETPEAASTTTNSGQNTSETPAQNTPETSTSGTETDTTTANTETPQPEVETPAIPQEEIRLVTSYLRQGVAPHQHYVKVEEVLAGPTPCNQDSLLISLDNSSLALQWQSEDRLEIYGAYLNEANGCQVSLNQSTHTVKVLPKTEPVVETQPETTETTTNTTTTPEFTEPETERQPESLLEYPVHIEATMTALRDSTAFFVVDRVIDGEFDCNQATVSLNDPANVQMNSQYEIRGLYDPVTGNCELRLVNPLLDFVLLTPPAIATPITETAVPEVIDTPVTPASPASPFYLSAGVSLVQNIPVFSGSGGISLTPELKGMGSFGMGSGEVELELPSGEPITADVNITLIEAAALFQVSGPFHVGTSGGVMMLSGDYDLPYPVSGSTRFSATIPIVSAMVGYELGVAMLTLSVGVALGG